MPGVQGFTRGGDFPSQFNPGTTMRYYYTDAANQPVGPCDLAQLQALAAEGKITDATSVIPEGGQVWSTYGAVKSGGAPAPVPAPPGQPFNPFQFATILGDTVATVLKLVSGWLTPALLKASLSIAERYGHIAVLVGSALGLIVALINSVKTSTMSSFFVGGVGFLLAIAVAQFSAMRFIGAGAALIATSPTRLNSKSFLECVGLFAVLGAATLLIGGVITAIRADSFLPIIPAVLISAFLTYLGLVALHPGEVNVNLEPGASAGEEAISVFSFFSKAGLKLTPLFFCLFAMLGAIATIFSMSERGATASEQMLSFLPIPLGSATAVGASVGTAVLLFGCLLPVLNYLAFLLSYLVIDLLRAQLSIPGKLDALKKSED
jgi:hypothetical protein